MGPWSQAAAVARRILLELARTRRSLVFWIVFPTLMLLLFGTIYAGGKKPGTSFDHTAPGILVGAALFFSCLGGTVSLLAAERERRTLRRLLFCPCRRPRTSSASSRPSSPLQQGRHSSSTASRWPLAAASTGAGRSAH